MRWSNGGVRGCWRGEVEWTVEWSGVESLGVAIKLSLSYTSLFA